jgi:hypothetical protein
LMFMFVEVPAPPWIMSTMNWSSCFPAHIKGPVRNEGDWSSDHAMVS